MRDKTTVQMWRLLLFLAAFLLAGHSVVQLAVAQVSVPTTRVELSVRSGKTWKVVPIKSVVQEVPLVVNCNCREGQTLLSIFVATDLSSPSATLEITGSKSSDSEARLCPQQIPVSASFGPIHLIGHLEGDSSRGATEYHGTLEEQGGAASLRLMVSGLTATVGSECPLQEPRFTQLESDMQAFGTISANSSPTKPNAAALPSLKSFEPSKGKTRFAKLAPKLSNPIEVVITKDGGFFPGRNGKEKIGPIDSDPGYSLTSLEDNSDIKVPRGAVYFFPFDRDVRIIISTPLTITQQIGIYGGRNVVVEGRGDGFITKKLDPKMPAPCDQTAIDCREKLQNYVPDVTGVLRFDSVRRSVVVRNLKIQVNGDFTDAIVFRQNPNTFASQEQLRTFGGIDIFIHDIEVYDIGGAGPGLHGDIVQLQNGIYRNMFFENIDGSTGYQGFFLPQRPRDNPNLCSIVKQKRPGSVNQSWEVKRCFSPIEVKGTAFFENITLRPIDPMICPHCPIPYRGLYSKDEDVIAYWDKDPTPKVIYKAPSYETQLQNVTFFTDPRPNPRNRVSLYIMPQPRSDTAEGTINMSMSTNGVTKGRLNVISTIYEKARDALLNSGWQSSVSSESKSPFPEAPEVSCDPGNNLSCSATYLFGTRKIVLSVVKVKKQGGGSELKIIGAHY